MRLSVAMATYQGSRYLGAQLDSITAQARPPDELVLLDDASTDDTAELARRHLAGAPFAVKIAVNERRLGVTANFAAAMARTTGDVIVLADQDDVWRADRLAALEQALADHPDVTAVFSDARLVGPDGEPLGGTLWDRVGFTTKRRARWSDDPFTVLLATPVATGATLAFRRDVLDTASPIPGEGWHDHWIALIAAAGGRVLALDQQLVDYRVHGDNVAGVPGSPLTRLRLRLADRSVIHRELAQYEAFADRLSTTGIGGDDLRTRVDAKLAHLRRRTTLPRRMGARAAVVASEVRRGNYARYARGMRSAAFDLLQG